MTKNLIDEKIIFDEKFNRKKTTFAEKFDREKKSDGKFDREKKLDGKFDRKKKYLTKNSVEKKNLTENLIEKKIFDEKFEKIDEKIDRKHLTEISIEQYQKRNFRPTPFALKIRKI